MTFDIDVDGRDSANDANDPSVVDAGHIESLDDTNDPSDVKADVVEIDNATAGKTEDEVGELELA